MWEQPKALLLLSQIVGTQMRCTHQDKKPSNKQPAPNHRGSDVAVPVDGEAFHVDGKTASGWGYAHVGVCVVEGDESRDVEVQVMQKLVAPALAHKCLLEGVPLHLAVEIIGDIDDWDAGTYAVSAMRCRIGRNFVLVKEMEGCFEDSDSGMLVANETEGVSSNISGAGVPLSSDGAERVNSTYDQCGGGDGQGFVRNDSLCWFLLCGNGPKTLPVFQV